MAVTLRSATALHQKLKSPAIFRPSMSHGRGRLYLKKLHPLMYEKQAHLNYFAERAIAYVEKNRLI